MFKKELNMGYNCWINYQNIDADRYIKYLQNLVFSRRDGIVESIITEINFALEALGSKDRVIENKQSDFAICLECANDENETEDESYAVLLDESGKKIIITAQCSKGHLYGVFYILKYMQLGKKLQDIATVQKPSKSMRMVNHWDRLMGTSERGYAGNSILFENFEMNQDILRIKDYARMLASIGINAVVINNPNVDFEATELMTKKIHITKAFNDIFKAYGIVTYISANFAAPATLGELSTADPLDEKVQLWWNEKCKIFYKEIPDFGGFVVKADSEGRPGPFTYNRTHAEGANLIARAIKPYGGIVIWRCFVYDCQQDWRDHTIDRAKAAYDNFKPLDGLFDDNVYLQVKNGPMDFQVREPVMPLFGAMPQTKLLLEFQITQEYTGQQKHICYLVPMWKEVFDFDTYANGKNTTVDTTIEGIAAIVNVGLDINWTGHCLAQANLYGYGALCWDSKRSTQDITEEWIGLTFGGDQLVKDTLMEIMFSSWRTYENYNAPLGVGWMVNPVDHYGPNVDGYEYSRWGTYHRSDCKEMGMDRTMETGTGYCGQYFEPNRSLYNNLETCPDDLLLFFHHVPYTHVLKSGKTLIQHIYDTHFQGYEEAFALRDKWGSLENKVNKDIFENVQDRIEIQIASAKDWCDIINTYYFRMTGIPDECGRKIY